MFSLAPTIALTRAFQRLIVLAVAGLLCALLIPALPSVLVARQTSAPARDIATPTTPAPVLPTTQQLPPGLGPVLNATLAADDAQDYAAVALPSSPDAVRAENPAQRFATTFGTGGVTVAPAGGAPFSLHATAILTANGEIAIPARQPISAGPRVEYRGDGLTEWYVNGPRGLEQGLTLAAAPAGVETFTVSLAVAGAVPTQTETGLMIGDLRYSDLAVIDAAGATLPAHLTAADGAIQIAVDARGAMWPVTIDPTVTAVTLSTSGNPSTFGNAIAIATSLHTTTVVVGAPADGAGSAYVFTGSGTTYTMRKKLYPLDVPTPTDPREPTDGLAYDHFGTSVAVVSRNGIATIAVGTYRFDNFGNGVGDGFGKVYVYEGQGTAYPYQTTLRASDKQAGDAFGISVAIATDGTATTIAVGANDNENGRTRAYTFVGSGSSYPQVKEFQGSGSGYYGDAFGSSVAIAISGGVNTIVVGAYFEDTPVSGSAGDIWVFTGTGTTYSAVRLNASDGAPRDIFGRSVAVATAHGQNTIVVGADAKGGAKGAAYVFVGSGVSYTQTAELTDSPGNTSAYFGHSVAVGFAGGATVIAVGSSNRNPQVAVPLFTGGGATYVESDLPESPAGSTYDNYGTSVALMTAVNGDVAVVGGAPGAKTATLSYYQTAPAANSIRASFGDGAIVASSPPGAFSGAPFTLVAAIDDARGSPAIPVDVTFTLNYAGAAHGRFDPSDPTGTTFHTTTLSNGDPRTDGSTPPVLVYPSDTAGSFTVTASVDGTQQTATFTLAIVQAIPVPTIGGAASQSLTSTGLSPPVIPATPRTPPDPTPETNITIYGSGFMLGYSHIWMMFAADNTQNIQVPDNKVVYFHGTEISAYIDNSRLTAGTLTNQYGKYINIFVNNTASANHSDGGSSPAVPLYIKSPAPPPPTTSKVNSVGASGVVLPSGTSALLGAGVYDPQGGTITRADVKMLSLISHDGGSLISHDGGSLVATGGGNLVSMANGTLHPPVTGSAAQKSGVGSPSAPPSSGSVAKPVAASAPQQNTLSDLPARNPYYGSSDANGVILSPPITSNGVPGTYTRTIAVDGIATPVTFTITNLDPNDGNPTTITSLSRTSAYTGDPAFPLTITGTGFISGSVISYGGVQLVTTYLSPTQVRATIPANLLNYAGALNVLVINPDPNGGASLPATFSVTQYVNPLPPPQPTAPPVTGPAPLPIGRPTGAPGGGGPPAPLPPHR